MFQSALKHGMNPQAQSHHSGRLMTCDQLLSQTPQEMRRQQKGRGRPMSLWKPNHHLKQSQHPQKLLPLFEYQPVSARFYFSPQSYYHN